MKKLILSLLVSLFAIAAHAGTATGHVINPYFMNTGVMLIPIDATVSGGPGCAATQTQRFALDTTTTVGKTQYTAILAAWMTGKAIIFTGGMSCNYWGDTESISSIQVIG